MYEELKGKQVLVTGAGSGIGLEIAEQFSKEGSVVGFHRKSEGFGCPFTGDLLRREVRENLIDNFVEAFGGIDILVNNAGACPEYKHYSELTEEECDRMFTLHWKAPFTLAREAMKYMKKQNWGRIIFISTGAIKFGGVNNMHYYSSKAAMDAMMRGFARDGATHDVLVNSIQPGVIDTPMKFKTEGYDEEKWQARAKLIPLGHPGEPEDIARMVLFLCSRGGDFITGEIIRIAGGE